MLQRCVCVVCVTFCIVVKRCVLEQKWGYRGGSPTAVRPSNPALCGSCPLVTPYYCRLGDLLCFVFIVRISVFFCYLCNVCVPSVLWYCWMVLLTCKNRRPYNLYCVRGDVKPCSSSSSSRTYLLIQLNTWLLLDVYGSMLECSLYKER